MIKIAIIKKLPNGKYRLVSRKKDKSGKRRNLGTFDSRAEAAKHEGDVNFFKSHSDDGECDDKETKALKQMSDIAGYLEESGMIDASDIIYRAMSAIDGGLEDNAEDEGIPDNQKGYLGSMDYMMSGEQISGSQNLFSIPVGEKLASLANCLDQLGLYSEADEIDDMLQEMLSDDDTLEIIDDLEININNTPQKKEKPKQQEESVARSSGKVGTGVYDNGTAGMSAGISDSFFYQGYGNLEGALGST